MNLKERVREILRIANITVSKTTFAELEEALREDRRETLAYCTMLVVTFADAATNESVMELDDELTEACRDIARGIESTDTEKDLRAEAAAEYAARDLDPDEFIDGTDDDDENVAHDDESEDDDAQPF